MNYNYKTHGTCSREISFDLTDGIITGVAFNGGCNGNLQGISRLVEGKCPEEIASLLSGIRCGMKNTSCPDQLAKAVLEAKAALKN